MQPTQGQVDASLAALTGTLADPGASAAGGDGGDASGSELAPEVVARLASLPPLRQDRVAEVRRRMAGGDDVSDEELAARMVGRLVCDRLR